MARRAAAPALSPLFSRVYVKSQRKKHAKIFSWHALAFQSKVCYNIRMDLTNTKLSRNQLLDIFDNLHKAVEALHKAHTIALKGDQKVASQLWNETSMPAVNLILAVTGDLLEAAKVAPKDKETTA